MAAALWHMPMPLEMDPTVSTPLPQVSCALRAELVPGSVPAVLAAPRPGEIRAGAPRAVSSAIPAARRRRFGSGSNMAPAAHKGGGKAKCHCDKPHRRPQVIIGIRYAPGASKGNSADN